MINRSDHPQKEEDVKKSVWVVGVHWCRLSANKCKHNIALLLLVPLLRLQHLVTFPWADIILSPSNSFQRHAMWTSASGSQSWGQCLSHIWLHPPVVAKWIQYHSRAQEFVNDTWVCVSTTAYYFNATLSQKDYTFVNVIKERSKHQSKISLQYWLTSHVEKLHFEV